MLDRVVDFPEQLVIETTAACNQACIFCGRTYMNRPKKTMAPALFCKIVDEVGKVSPYTEVWPTFMGEALLLGRKLWDLIAYAKAAGCRKITLNSNGSRLDQDENIEGVLSSGVDRFIVSFDAFTRATHLVVRPGIEDKHGVPRDFYTPMMLGFQRLLDERRRRGLQRPILEAQFSCFDENEHEREVFVDYWLDRGAVVKTRPKLYWAGQVNGGAPLPERVPCLWAKESMAIHWNGNVVACPVDAAGEFVAGNVNEQSVSEIWRGPLRDLRKLHVDKMWDDLPAPCKTCPDWHTKEAVTYFSGVAAHVNYEAYVRHGRSRWAI